METVTLSAQQIQSILPHRFPFLLIDRVTELSKDRVVAVKNVSINEPFFQGHFPGQPVMPGVLQVEAIAQAGGILAAHSGDFDTKTQVMVFMGMDKVKFRRPVVPGDQLVIEVEPLRRGRIWKIKGSASVAGGVVCQAELLATSGPRDGGN